MIEPSLWIKLNLLIMLSHERRSQDTVAYCNRLGNACIEYYLSYYILYLCMTYIYRSRSKCRRWHHAHALVNRPDRLFMKLQWFICDRSIRCGYTAANKFAIVGRLIRRWITTSSHFLLRSICNYTCTDYIACKKEKETIRSGWRSDLLLEN